MINRNATALAASAICVIAAGSVSAATLLDTHFDGTGSAVSGGTLSGFDYTTSDGLTGGAMSIVPELTTDNSDGNTNPDSLFALNQSASGSHFAPDVQMIGGRWAGDLAFSVDSNPVTIDSISIERQHLNNGAALNNGSQARRYFMTVSLIGSVSGVVATDSVNDSTVPAPVWGNTNSVELFDMGGVTLDSSETWVVRVESDGTASTGLGVYVAIDTLTIDGSVVPEPATGAMALVGLGALAMRRRRG